MTSKRCYFAWVTAAKIHLFTTFLIDNSQNADKSKYPNESYRGLDEATAKRIKQFEDETKSMMTKQFEDQATAATTATTTTKGFKNVQSLQRSEADSSQRSSKG